MNKRVIQEAEEKLDEAGDNLRAVRIARIRDVARCSGTGPSLGMAASVLERRIVFLLWQ